MTSAPPTLEMETGADPRASIIILHGLGADGSDFAPFVQEIDLAAAGPVRWLFPNAPQIPVTINGGCVMPAWYDITADRRQEDEAGLRRSQASIGALLAREQARGVPAERIVLGGFSQGCAMALLTGLRYPERLAGIVGMSGYLPLAGKLAAERSSANRDVPIFLAHGTQDEMVALPRAIASRDALAALDYPLEWHDYPMGHSVCAPEVQDLRRWLLRALAAKAQ
ncbi:alpha/beta hydrolase [Ottowia testudinis]|uniref:Dienelactone hydrolase family protein n=1 Tax=Ottowia testudinis TaxID=2816950 RepID=A0A975H7B6_9BURK|nr:PHB depolymerase family esterase [Ottowia testudinis]QTD46877.1 dienelactone hydrolase family protein [Ottowia testudinis]